MKVLKIAAIVVVSAVAIATGVGMAAGFTLAQSFGSAMGFAASLTGSSALATSIVAASVAITASTALEALFPKPSMGGSQTKWKADPYAGLPYVMGRTLVGGNVVGKFLKGANNAFMGMATVLSIGPIHAYEASYMNKTTMAWSRDPLNSSGVASAFNGFLGYIWEQRSLGQCPETYAVGQDEGYAGWNSANKLSGLAAVFNSFCYNSKDSDTLTSIPTPGWIVQGVLVYDPRLDSTYPGGSGPCRALDESTYVYSEDPHLHALTWCLGRWQNGVRVAGLGAPINRINVASFVEGANLNDARGWKLGGQVYTRPDTPWNSLKAMLQAGGAQPAMPGGIITAINRAPRVSLATITHADIVGKCTFSGTQKRRTRINGIIPQYRSESHDWEMVSAKLVQVADYVTIDGGERTKEISYPLVQNVDQVAKLAAYDICDAREAGPGTIPLKPAWMNFAIGDCVTFQPEDGWSIKILITGRSFDPSTGSVTYTVRGETDDKHAFALGETGVAPAIASLTYDNTLAAPTLDWSLAGVSLTTAEGASVPALVIEGAVSNAAADLVVFDYRLYHSSQADDDGWLGASYESPTTARKEITSVTPNTAYQVSVRYRVRGVLGPRAIFGPVNTGAGFTGDLNATNGAPSGTPVGGTTADAVSDAVKNKVPQLQQQAQQAQSDIAGLIQTYGSTQSAAQSAAAAAGSSQASEVAKNAAEAARQQAQDALNAANGAATGATTSADQATQRAKAAAQSALAAAQSAQKNLWSRTNFSDGLGQVSGAIQFANGGPFGTSLYVAKSNSVDMRDGEALAGNWSSRKIRCRGYVYRPSGVTNTGVGIWGVNASGQFDGSWASLDSVPANTWTAFDVTITTSATLVKGQPFCRSDAPYGMMWDLLVWEDVTESNTAKAYSEAAQGQASNAAGSASWAEQKAGVATQSASDAQGYSQAASGYAEAAHTSSTNAGTYADAAHASMQKAETEAGHAKSWASDAAQSSSDAHGWAGAAQSSAQVSASARDGAVNVVQALLPPSLSPTDRLAYQIDGMTVIEGPSDSWKVPYLARLDPNSNRALSIYPVKGIPTQPGRRYRAWVWVVGDATNAYLAQWIGGSAGESWPGNATNLTGDATNVAPDCIGGGGLLPSGYAWRKLGFDYTVPASGWPAYQRPIFQILGGADGSQNINGTVYVSGITFDDITSEYASKQSALAAAGSASSASGSKDQAQGYAEAAHQSYTNAQTEAGHAQTYAGEASRSMQDAAGYSSSAATSSGLSATYASAAASGNIVTKGIFEDQKVGTWANNAPGTYGAGVGILRPADFGQPVPPLGQYVLQLAGGGGQRDWYDTRLYGAWGGRKIRITGAVSAQYSSRSVRLGINSQNAAGANSFYGSGAMAPAGQVGYTLFDEIVTLNPDAVSVAPWVCLDGDWGTSGMEARINWFRLEDVTESQAAAGSASAANGSWQAASVQADQAQQSASAAHDEFVKAQTQAGNAQADASRAAQSYRDAEGERQLATQQADLATQSKKAAGDSATAALQQAGFAKTSADNAQGSAQAAQDYASAAQGYRDGAQSQAGFAAGYASQADGYRAATQTYRDQASGFRGEAQGYAEAAQRSATAASDSEASAASSAAQAAQFTAGGNLLSNTDYANGSAVGWDWGSTSASMSYEAVINGAGDDWHPQLENVFAFHQNGSLNDQNQYLGLWQQIAVQAGRWYQGYAFCAAHRCLVDVYLIFLDTNGNWLSVNGVERQAVASGGKDTNNWTQLGIQAVQAPTGAVKAILEMRKRDTASGQGDSWAWFWRPYIGPAKAGQTGWNNFVQGSASAQIIEARSALQQEVSNRADAVSAVGKQVNELSAQYGGLSASVSSQSLAISTLQSQAASYEQRLSAGSPNLLKNGSGELGKAYWSDRSGVWGAVNDAWGSRFVCSNSGNGTWYFDSDPIQVNGNLNYVGAFDCDVRASSGTDQWARIEYLWYATQADALTMANLVRQDYGPNVSQPWFGNSAANRQASRLSVVAPSNANFVRVRLVGGGTNITSVALRQVKFEQGSVASAYSQEATVLTQAGAIADATGRTRAYLQQGVVAGNGRAQLTLYADSNGGGGVDLVGDLRVSGAAVFDGSLTANKIEANGITLAQQAYNGQSWSGSNQVITGYDYSDNPIYTNDYWRLSFDVVMARPGDIIVIATAKQGYSSGLVGWEAHIEVNGNWIAQANGSGGYSDNIALSGKTHVSSAGTYTVTLAWKGGNTSIVIDTGRASLITLRTYA